jgi:hypothetical protein
MTFGKNEMKLGLQNYAVARPIENSSIKFNGNKINSLQRYCMPKLHNFTQSGSAFVPA